MANNICERCGFTLNDNFLFCPGCGKDLQKQGICLKCGYKNKKDANFCQKCGNSMKPEARPKAEEEKSEFEDVQKAEIPSSGVTIEFAYSSSRAFEFAVEEAKNHPTFNQFGDAKKAIHRVTYSLEEMELASKLAENLKGSRSRIVYVDGEKVPWDTVFSFTLCYGKKQASYKPELYCFGYENEWEHNIWGCLNSRLYFRENGDWFCWGSFTDKKGTWRFDKDRIRHELEKNLYPYRFCPAFEEGRVEEVLKAFPDEANPAKDKNWKFVESWEDNVPGLVVTVSRYGYEEKVIMKGVCPKGYGALKELAKKLKFELPLEFGK